MNGFRRLTALAAVCFAGLLCACGGILPDPNRLSTFEGNWAGRHRFLNNFGARQDAGDIRFSVNRGGALSGFMTKDSTGENVPITGSVAPGGRVTIVWEFDGFGGPRIASGDIRFTRRDRFEGYTNDQEGLPATRLNGSQSLGRLGFFVSRQTISVP